MTESLIHRGPDAGGVFVDQPVALGHRRLSIIDTSAAGAQPMSFTGKGGTTTIAYNGESYNFTVLREELRLLGHEFIGHSDTEVALHVYVEWGLEGLNRLEGIFALALWDEQRGRLVLMRDKFGVKPLYYSIDGGRVVFGSEIKALMAAGGIDKNIDDQALAEYLWYGNTFEDRTIYQGIRSLPPGHRLVVEHNDVRDEVWWQLEDWLSETQFEGDFVAAAQQVRETLDFAVKRQLVSDVPVCIFLSGGIDSSAIAAAAVHSSSSPLTSYAVGFDFAGGVDELPKAKQVADELGLDHQELHVSGAAIQQVIEELVSAHDEPFADAANIPLYLLAKELGGSHKVALQGDGGDELFAGYRRYALLEKAALWKWWPQWFSQFLHFAGGAKGRRLGRLGAAIGANDPAMRMALLLTMESQFENPEQLLTIEEQHRLERTADPFAAFRRCAARFSFSDPIKQMLLTDMTLQLPSQFLPKVDRATMANGLESRVPLLDDSVVKLALSLPTHMKISGGQKKRGLREALRPRIPARILDGPKTGFGVPYGQWLAGPLFKFASDALLEPSFVDRFSIDPQRMRVALDSHHSGTRSRGFTLWKYFQLALWHRNQ